MEWKVYVNEVYYWLLFKVSLNVHFDKLQTSVNVITSQAKSNNNNKMTRKNDENLTQFKRFCVSVEIIVWKIFSFKRIYIAIGRTNKWPTVMKNISIFF